MYCGTGNVYANLWRVRGPVCGDYEGLFVSVAGKAFVGIYVSAANTVKHSVSSDILIIL